jgi:hypothetical protein
MIEDTWESSERPAHPSPFCGGQGGDPKRSLGLGRVFRLRFPRQGTVPWGGAWARRGCDSGARRDDRLVRSVVVSSIRQIAGGDLTPQPTGGARRYSWA